MKFPFKITVEKRVADAINERGIVVMVAGKKFKMLPTTLSQIADISAVVSTMTDMADMPECIEKNIDAYSEVFKHGLNARQQVEIAAILLFRDEDAREQNYDFITTNLTQAEFKPIYNFMLESIDAGFFLTSTIILKGMNQMAPTKTTPLL